jgi:hypothetical protein
VFASAAAIMLVACVTAPAVTSSEAVSSSS